MSQTIYAVLGQKGGSGKSTISYALAVQQASIGKKVLVADMDTEQHTISMWHEIRADKTPRFDVAKCSTLADVGKKASGYDVVIIDGIPHASKLTLEAAECSHRVIIPTGTALADLTPSVKMASQLVSRGVERDAIRFVVVKAPSDAETKSAIETIEAYDFKASPHGLRFLASYAKAQDKGQSVTEVSLVAQRVAARTMIESLALEQKHG